MPSVVCTRLARPIALAVLALAPAGCTMLMAPSTAALAELEAEVDRDAAGPRERPPLAARKESIDTNGAARRAASDVAGQASGGRDQGSGTRGQGPGGRGQRTEDLRSAEVTKTDATQSNAAAAVRHKNDARLADDPVPDVAQVVERLASSDRLDAATRARLLADLAQANPAVLPQLTEALAAAAQYADRRANEAAADPAIDTSERTTVPASAADGRPNVLRSPANHARTVGASPIASTAASLPAAAETTLASASSPVVSAPPVTPPTATASEPTPPLEEHWQAHLAAAIAGLERDAVAAPQSPAELQQQVQLRLLRLAAGDVDSAAQPIAGIPPAEQEYWSEQLYALAIALDGQKLPDSARRAAAAGVHLRAAATRLADRATLAVRNLAFCTEVKGYGSYTPFPKYDFRASQKLVLYLEVENFQSEAGEGGYRTALRTSYRILDGQGQRIDAKEFGVEEDLCKNQRRDLSLRYYMWMPASLAPGRYTLEVTVEDTLGHKFGSSTVEFTAVR